MKTIDIKQQPILSFSRTLQIAVTGVRYRLFRAAVTVAVIAVAMAFLMNILSESLIKKNVAWTARDGIAALHLAETWMAKLTLAQTEGALMQDLASITPGDPLYQELQGFSGLDPAAFSTVCQQARLAYRYLSFFNGIDYGRLRLLFADARGTEIFDYLQQPERRDRFFDNLAKLRSIRLVTSTNELHSFLAHWPEQKERHGRIITAQKQAINRVQQTIDGRTAAAGLAQATGSFGETVREAGFVLPPATAEQLERQIKRSERIRLIDQSIGNETVRRAVAARLDILPIAVTRDHIWDMLADEDDAGWYAGVLSDAGRSYRGIEGPELTGLADYRGQARLLKKAELATIDTGDGGFMGIGIRMTWLAFVSMLVCVVGITNAMLMSVTERFREIATLKCLGALDGFIMTVFLIESCIMGLVGGMIGSMIGLLLCVIRMLFVFRSLLLASFPLGAIATAVGFSVIAGIIISAIAAVYPSLRAARLAPMEAMRIE